MMSRYYKAERFTQDICQRYPEYIFLFGDNKLGKGKAGQAVIRDEPNAFGIITKRLPSMHASSFFADSADDLQKLSDSIRRAKSDGRPMVLPTNMIGTGLAKIDKVSPQAFEMIKELYDEAVDATLIN